LRIETGMHTAVIRGASVDGAGRYFLTVSEDKTARVWEVSSGKLVRTIRVPIGLDNEGALLAGAISPDGNTIAVSGVTGLQLGGRPSIYLFDRESGRMMRRIDSAMTSAKFLSYSPDGRFLVATYSNGFGIRVYDTSTYSFVADETGYIGSSTFADFDRKGRLVTTGADGYVRLYAPPDHANKIQLVSKVKTFSNERPFAAVFSPDGTRVAVTSADSAQIAIISGNDLSSLYSVSTEGVGNRNLASVAWSDDGTVLYAGGEARDSTKHNFIRTWQDAGRGPIRDIQLAASNTVTRIATVPRGGLIYCTGDPSIGDLDNNGRVVFVIGPKGADFRGNANGFRLARDGSGVAFAYESGGGSPAKFNFSDRSLTVEANVDPDWRIPITEVAGLNVTDWKNSHFPKLNGKALPLDNNEYANRLAFSPDSGVFALATNFGIVVFDHAGAFRWGVHAPGGVWGVNFSANGRFAVAAFGDGTIRWFSATDGKELLALYPHSDHKRWVAWTPEGYYDCSPGAEDLIGWHVNNGTDQAADFYPVGQFFEKFYHPKLLAQVLTPEGMRPPDANARNAISINRNLIRPPLVSITSPKPGAAFNTDAVQIVVATTDQGGGVDEIRLYQNGKLVSDDTRLLVQGSSTATNKTFNVTLVAGINTFRATAFNKDRTESNPVEIQIELKAAVAESDLYILAIGLNDYKNPKYSLNYGRADAQAFADAAEAHGRGIFRKINKQVILDGQATRAGIEEAFAKIIAQAKPQDAFVFYFAGHGVMSEGDDQTAAEFYLVPFDVVQLYGNDGALATNGVAAKLLKDLCTRVRAQKQLIVLDACQSAGVLETFATRGAAEEKAVLQLARSAGVVVLAATGQDQVATEFPKLGHGVFTYALLQAMNGDADGGNPPDGKITATEIVAFINDRVPELTKQYRGKTQYPNAWARGQDFPLGIR
jgi:WD40 repeat protein